MSNGAASAAHARVACVFPGQGSQRVGMGRDLAEQFAVARDAFAEASDCLGMRLDQLCFAGPDERLRETENCQPAILTTSVATFRALVEVTGLVPSAVAGHSLGEWSALVVAGALSLGDAVRAVRERGRLMQAAVPVGTGAMAAVMGLEASEVAALCAESAGNEILTPANLNGGGQVVVAGHAAAVERLIAKLRERKVRAQWLAVSAPFHCALMAPAREALARYLAGVNIATPGLPVFTSVEARRVRNAADVRDLLARQVTTPVRWEETVRALVQDGVAAVVEVGPGRALTGLVKRIAPTLRTSSVGDAAAVKQAKDAWT